MPEVYEVIEKCMGLIQTGDYNNIALAFELAISQRVIYKLIDKLRYYFSVLFEEIPDKFNIDDFVDWVLFLNKIFNLKEYSYREFKGLGIPEGIKLLNTLESINISNCKIQRTGMGMGLLKNLQSIILDRNFIEITDFMDFKMPNLKELDLSNNRLFMILKHIKNLSGLEKLKLNLNYIQELPPEIGELRNLKYLNISFNYLKKIPEELLNNKSLEILIANNNQFSDQYITDLKHRFEGTRVDLVIDNLTWGDIR